MVKNRNKQFYNANNDQDSPVGLDGNNPADREQNLDNDQDSSVGLDGNNPADHEQNAQASSSGLDGEHPARSEHFSNKSSATGDDKHPSAKDFVACASLLEYYDYRDALRDHFPVADIPASAFGCLDIQGNPVAWDPLQLLNWPVPKANRFLDLELGTHDFLSSTSKYVKVFEDESHAYAHLRYPGRFVHDTPLPRFASDMSLWNDHFSEHDDGDAARYEKIWNLSAQGIEPLDTSSDHSDLRGKLAAQGSIFSGLLPSLVDDEDAQRARDFLDNFNKAADSVTEFSGTGTGKLVTILDSLLRSVIDVGGSVVSFITENCKLVVSFLACFLAAAGTSIATIMSSFMKVIDFLPKHWASVMEALSSWWDVASNYLSNIKDRGEPNAPQHEGDLDAQAYASNTAIQRTALVSIALAVMISMHGSSVIKQETNLELFMRCVKTAGNLAKGIGITLVGATMLMKQLPESAQDILVDWQILDRGFDTRLPFVQSLFLLNEAIAVWEERLEKKRDPCKDHVLCERIVRYFQEVEATAHEYMVVDTDPTRRRFITNVLNLAKKRVVKARAAIEAGIKVTPAGIYLMGPPGIGKSVLTSMLALRSFPNHSNPNNIAAPVSPIEKFQSCYRGHPAIVVDELPNGSQEFADILASWMSMNRSTVHMAAVEDKGTQFVAKLVLATGNTSIESVKTSLTQQAWRRRWTAIKVSLRDGFALADGTLDVEKLNALPAEERKHFPHLSFERIGVKPFGAAKHPVEHVGGFEDLVNMVQGIMAAHQTSFEKLQEAQTLVTREKEDKFVPRSIRELFPQGSDCPEPEQKRPEADEDLPLPARSWADIAEDNEPGPPRSSAFGIMEARLIQFATDIKFENRCRFGVKQSVGIVAAKRLMRKHVAGASILEKHRELISRRLAEMVPRVKEEFKGLLDFYYYAYYHKDFAEEYRKLEAEGVKFAQRIDEDVLTHRGCEFVSYDEAIMSLTHSMSVPQLIRLRHTLRARLKRTQMEKFGLLFVTPDSAKWIERVEKFMEIAKGLTILAGAVYGVSTLMGWLSSSSPNTNPLEDAFVVDQLLQGQGRHRTYNQGHGRSKDSGGVTSRSKKYARLNKYGERLHAQGRPVAPEDLDRANRVMSSMACISVPGKVGAMNGFLMDDYLCAPRHFFHAPSGELKLGDQIRLATSDTVTHLDYDPALLEVANGDTVQGVVDFVRYKLPFSLTGKRLTSRYLKPHDHTGSKEYYLFGRHIDGSPRIQPVHNLKRDMRTHAWEVHGERVAMGNMYSYNGTKKGDCGMLLVCLSPNVQVMGMHVAGKEECGNFGVSLPINNTMFLTAQGPNLFEPEPPIVGEGTRTTMVAGIPYVEAKPKGFGDSPVPEGFRSLTTVIEPILGHSKHSKLEPSPLFDNPFLKDITDTRAMLGGRGEPSTVALILENLQNSNKGNPHLLSEFREEIALAIAEELKLQQQDRGLPPSLEEAGNMVAHLPGLKPINLSTSCGTPYAKASKLSGKLGFVERREEGIVITCPSFRAWLHKCDEQLRRGERPFFRFQMGVKDELRPARKEGKPRTIVLTGIDHLYLMRYYFAPLISATQVKGGRYAVGMNVTSPEWGEMISDLASYGTQGFDGDYSGMEDHFNPQVASWVKDICRIFFEGCPEEENIARETLIDASLHANLVVGNQVLRQPKGNPSGIACTTVFSCMMCDIFLRHSWLVLTKDQPSMHSMLAYSQHVGQRIYGDDNIQTVSPDARRFYNMRKVAWAMALHGVNYTSADKVSVYELRPLIELEFLKNTTRFAPGENPGIDYYPIPGRNSLLRSAKWVRRDEGDLVVATVVNLNNALSRAVGMSKADFKTLRDEMHNMLLEAGLMAKLLDHSSLLRRFRSGTLDEFSDAEVPGFYDPRPVVVKVLPNNMHRLTTEMLDEFDRLSLSDDVSLLQAQGSRLGDNPFTGMIADPSLNKEKDKRVVEIAPTLQRGPLTTGETINHLSDIIGRQGTIRTGPLAISLADLVISGANVINQTPFGWFAALFRVHAGSAIVTIDSTARVRLSAIVGTIADIGGSPLDSEAFGMGPLTFVQQDHGFVQAKLPYISSYRVLLVPRSQAEKTLHRCNAGSFIYEGDANAIYMAAGDDYRFASLWYTPRISVTGPLLAERRPRELRAQGPGDDSAESKPMGAVIESDEVQASTAPVMAAGDNPVDGGGQFYSYADTLGRPNLIGNLRWDTTQLAGTVLARFDLPFDGFTNNLSRQAVSSFSLLRGTMKVQIMVQSPIFQSGLLIAYWLPLTNPVEALSLAGRRVPQTFTRHAFVFAGGSQLVTMDIPYVNPLSHLRTGTNDSLGTLVIEVFNPLLIGQYATLEETVAEVTVYFSMPESRLSVPDSTAAFLAAHPKISLQQQPVMPLAQANDRGPVARQPRKVPRSKGVLVELEPQGAAAAKMASVGGTARNVAQAAIAGIDQATSLVSDLGSHLDKPNDGGNPVQLVQRGVPNISTGKDLDMAPCLALDPGRTHDLSLQDVPAEEDEMDLSYIRSRPTYMETFRLVTDQGAGVPVWQTRICPCPKILVTNPPGPGNTTVIDPSTLEYTTMPFGFWTGGLEYTFQFVGTKLHSGRLAVMAHYFQDLGANPNIDDAMAQFYTVIDFSMESPTITIKVPYRSTREWMRVPNIQTNPFDPSIEDYVTGFLSMRIINPLRSVESVEDFVDVNVYISASPDFRTDYLCHNAHTATALFEPGLGA